MSRSVSLRKKVNPYCEVRYNLDDARWEVICDGAFVGGFRTYKEAIVYAYSYEQGPPTEPMRRR